MGGLAFDMYDEVCNFVHVWKSLISRKEKGEFMKGDQIQEDKCLMEDFHTDEWVGIRLREDVKN